MSRSRLIIALVLVIGVVGTMTVAYTDDSSQELVSKIEALEKRIASLERTLNARFTALEQAVAKGFDLGHEFLRGIVRSARCTAPTR